MYALARTGFHRGFQLFTYPLFVIAGFTIYFSLADIGVNHFLASTIPVLICLICIFLLETKFPYRDDWRANYSDIKADLAFLVIVQGIAPKILALGVGLLLARSGFDPEILAGIWPKHWSVLAQTLLMILLADLLRYWLHVAAHKVPLLWKFHAIHHQPKKLYSVNVARFHPTEKFFQFLFDTLPFILLGVGAEVIACYFVFYAINGFIQHSNINLKFGFLNYIVSTSELHRWHHDEANAVANCNYGNNLIIWDLLFGSYYFPKHQSRRNVGIKGVEPSGFLEAIRLPYKGAHGFRKIKDRVINLAISLLYKLAKIKYWRKFQKLCDDPEAAQDRLLENILSTQAETRFGQEHGFSSIESYREYRHRVPVRGYEDLRPYIEKQATRNSPEATRDDPILYAQTSGSTGKPKYIPITRKSLASLRISQTLASLMMHEACSGAFDGKMMTIVSPAEEGYNEWGKPCGSASGLIVKNSPAIVRQKYLLPFEVFEIQDHDLKYDLILLLALAEENITFLGTANPSTLLHLANLINRKSGYYLDILAGNTDSISARCGCESARKVLAKIDCSAERLQALTELFASNRAIDFADLWPGLRLVMTWTGGSCGIPLDLVAGGLPDACKIMDPGYVASEFRGTMTHLGSGLGIPTLHENFFEFVEKESWEAGVRKFLRLHEIEKDRQYYVFITNQNGLYRYDMNDIVEVSGLFRRTPCLKFIQKGKGTTNITGEKLYEAHLIGALKTLALEHDIHPSFYVCLADEADSKYELYLETSEADETRQQEISTAVDNALTEQNLEYKAKRASKRLKQLVVKLLKPGTFEIYKKRLVAQGQRESQFKVMTLQYCRENDFPFDEHLVA